MEPHPNDPQSDYPFTELLHVLDYQREVAGAALERYQSLENVRLAYINGECNITDVAEVLFDQIDWPREA